MVTPILLTTGSSTTNTATYTTASIAPTPGRLVLVAVLATVGSGTTTVDVAGCGLNWVKVDQTPSAARTAHLFRGMGTPTAGPLTITGGSQMTSALWQVDEFNAVDTSGTDGSGAIAQSVNARPGSATLVDVPFPNPVDPANSVYAAVGVAVQESPVVGGAPWTSLGTTTQSAPTSGLLGEFAATARQNITASWTTAAASFVVGAEIKSAATVGTPTGAASGTLAYAGTAAGVSQPFGSATGTLDFVGTAVGGNSPNGAAVGTLAFVGTATGLSDRSGSALGVLAFTGSAVGSRATVGGAIPGTLAFTGSAVGVAPIDVATGHTYGFAALVGDGRSSATLAGAPPSTAALAPTSTGGFGLDFGLSFGVATPTGAADGASTAVLTDAPGRAVLQTT